MMNACPYIIIIIVKRFSLRLSCEGEVGFWNVYLYFSRIRETLLECWISCMKHDSERGDIDELLIIGKKLWIESKNGNGCIRNFEKAFLNRDHLRISPTVSPSGLFMVHYVTSDSLPCTRASCKTSKSHLPMMTWWTTNGLLKIIVGKSSQD